MTRFYESPPWRFAVTDLNSAVVTFLDRLASARGVTYTLDAPAICLGTVPSDDPEINILLPDPDGEPFLSNSDRLLYGLRREAPDSLPPWVCRFAGIVMPVQDVASSDQPTTAYSAFDPWQLLYSRPAVSNLGLLPGQNGFRRDSVGGMSIAVEFLTNTDVAHGTCRIDYGQTAFYAGTIEATSPVSLIVQQGSSVGDVWDQLVKMGALDIVLTPIYDPINRPGFLAELNIYQTAGLPRYDAIFAWDMPSRSLVGVDHLRDGGALVNEFQPFVGQGGVPATLQTNPPSVLRYGQYWAQQFFPNQNLKLAVEAAGLAELILRARGKETLTIAAAAERSPLPFQEYFLGDTVPVYASNRLRQPLTGMQRVYAIPLLISDSALEHVDQLLMTPPGG